MRALVLILLISVLPVSHVRAQEITCFQEDGTGLRLDDSRDWSGVEHVIVGEFHSEILMPEIKTALVKFFFEKAGITDIYIETGLAAAYLFNRYLATGDTQLITHPDLVYASTTAGRNFWEDLYKFNQVHQQKIVIHGMDFERMDFLKVMKLLKDNSVACPLSIAKNIQFIDTVDVLKCNAESLVATYNSFRIDLKRHRQAYKLIFGKHFPLVSRILNNANVFAAYEERNERMYANVVEPNENGRVVGKYLLFCGMQHANKALLGTLANRLSAAPGTIAIGSFIFKDSSGNEGHPLTKGVAPYGNDRSLIRTLMAQLPTGCNIGLKPTASIADDRVRASSDYLILIRK